MKKVFLKAALLLLAVSLFSCNKIKSSGVEVERVHIVSANISDISFGSAAEVVFTDDIDINAVEISISDNLLKYLTVEEVGSELKIHLRSVINIWNHDLKIKAHISKFSRIEASGASDVYFAKPLEVPDFSLELSGASTAKGLNITATNSVEVDMSGASKLTNTVIECSQLDMDLSGASTMEDSQGSVLETMELDCLGSSSFRSYGLVCENIQVEISGSSKAEVTANGWLRGDVSGASTLYYKGKARSEVNTSGASKVKYIE